MASTQQIFDNFYNTTLDINGNEFEIVLSYFRSVTTSASQAQSFTNLLFVISANAGIPVLDLLGQLKGKTGVEMDATLAYYFNAIRGGVVLYGIAEIPQPNRTVQRNVLA